MKNNRDRILIIAPSYYGIDTSIAKAFEKNDCEAILVNYKVNASLSEKIVRKVMSYSPVINRVLHPCLKSLLLSENKKYIALAKTANPQFVFIVKGESVFPSTLQYLKRNLKIIPISYQWDDPFFTGDTNNGIDDYRKNNFRLGMKYYGHIFAFDSYYVHEIRNKGVDNVSYLPLATDEDLYSKTYLSNDEKKRYGYDVCFVGMPFDNRIEIFNELREFNVGVFGDLWDRCSGKVKGDYVKGPASGDKVLKIYSASKIVMNINHPQSIYGVNTRTFDIPACGAFEIMDYKKGVEDLFDIGREIVCYRDVSELKTFVRYYLDHPEKRKEIAENGCLRARREHTWDQRVKTILDVLHNKYIQKTNSIH
jgi:spore maturation protein CgeB